MTYLYDPSRSSFFYIQMPTILPGPMGSSTASSSFSSLSSRTIVSGANSNDNLQSQQSSLSLVNNDEPSSAQLLKEEISFLKSQNEILWSVILEAGLADVAVQRGATEGVLEKLSSIPFNSSISTSFCLSGGSTSNINACNSSSSSCSSEISSNSHHNISIGNTVTANSSSQPVSSSASSVKSVSLRKGSFASPNTKHTANSTTTLSHSTSTSNSELHITSLSALQRSKSIAVPASSTNGSSSALHSPFTTSGTKERSSSGSLLPPILFDDHQRLQLRDPFTEVDDHELSPNSPQSSYVVTFLKCEWDFDEKGKDVSRYYFSIKPPSAEGWIIEKCTKDFIDLEGALKKELVKTNYERYGKINDKSLLGGQSPSSRDLKKTALEFYLHQLLVNVPNAISIKRFITNNRITTTALSTISYNGSGGTGYSKESSQFACYIKEGYMIKRGSFFTPWIVRYYRLKNYRLDYYQTKYGPVHGSIKLPTMTVGVIEKDDDYKHALIIQSKTQQFSVILCTENDTERDEWIHHIRNVINDSKSTLNPFPTPNLSSIGMYNSQSSASITNTGNIVGGLNRDNLNNPFDEQQPAGIIRNDAESIYFVAGNEKRNFSLPSTYQKSVYGRIYEGSRLRDDVSVMDDSSSIVMIDESVDEMGEEEQLVGKELSSFSTTLNVSNEANPPITVENSSIGYHRHEAHPSKVFAVPLKDSSLNRRKKIPSVVQRCIEYLEENEGYLEEGIFRVSGSASAIKSLRERFDCEGDVDLNALSPDVHTVSGLLKLFFRELPENIMGPIEQELATVPVSTSSATGSSLGRTGEGSIGGEKQLAQCKEIIKKLPEENKIILEYLLRHLKKVIDNSTSNKMTLKNVGIVFSATLSVPPWIFLTMLGGIDQIFR